MSRLSAASGFSHPSAGQKWGKVSKPLIPTLSETEYIPPSVEGATLKTYVNEMLALIVGKGVQPKLPCSSWQGYLLREQSSRELTCMYLRRRLHNLEMYKFEGFPEILCWTPVLQS